MINLLELVREFDAVDHAELDQRLVGGVGLDAKCQSALEKRMALGDQIQAALADKRDAFEERFEALTNTHPKFPWPAEVVARQMGLISAPELGQARGGEYAVRDCGCVDQGADLITRCDNHAQPQP